MISKDGNAQRQRTFTVNESSPTNLLIISHKATLELDFSELQAPFQNASIQKLKGRCNSFTILVASFGGGCSVNSTEAGPLGFRGSRALAFTR